MIEDRSQCANSMTLEGSGYRWNGAHQDNTTQRPLSMTQNCGNKGADETITVSSVKASVCVMIDDSIVRGTTSHRIVRK